MTALPAELESVLAAIRACRHCVEAPQGKPLPHEPRPVLRASSTALLAVCSQAPGTKVHALGHAVHRPVRRPLAGLDGGHGARVLRRGPRRHRAHGVLLSRAGRRTAPTFRRGANARGSGMASCLRHCRSSSSCWRSDLTRKSGISEKRRGRICRRRCSAGASISSASGVRACCRCRTRPGATMLGSETIPGSRGSFCPCSGARCGGFCEKPLARSRIIIYLSGRD